MGTQRSRDEWEKRRGCRRAGRPADEGNITAVLADKSEALAAGLKALKRNLGGPGGREPDDATRPRGASCAREEVEGRRVIAYRRRSSFRPDSNGLGFFIVIVMAIMYTPSAFTLGRIRIVLVPIDRLRQWSAPLLPCLPCLLPICERSLHTAMP